MPTHKVGGEVDAFCTRCKMALAHTILAMVGQRSSAFAATHAGAAAYRGAGGTTQARSRPRPAAPRPPAPRPREPAVKTVIGFEEQLKGKDLTGAQVLAPRTPTRWTR